MRLFILFLFSTHLGFSQEHTTVINAILNTSTHHLKIQQKIVFYNSSKDYLSVIYLHNWMNSYKDNKTPLSQRLLSDYDRSLYFSKEKDKGFSKIINISQKQQSLPIVIDEKTPDIVKILLNEPLEPNDSITLNARYIVKIPKDKFTRYGRNKNNYNLRYWHLTPAVYDTSWQKMSNFNMDDLYMSYTNYKLNITIPKDYFLESDLNQKKISYEDQKKTYHLFGNKRVDATLFIGHKNEYNQLTNNQLKVSTNLNTYQLKKEITTAITKRQIDFIETFLGKYPYQKILLDKIIYDKNPVYGLTQLPKILNPFPKVFKFDIKSFKVMTQKFINNTINTNRRKDTWLNDGIQTYLMMKYVEKYYPDMKALGNVSKLWGFRTYQLAKLDFNKKYGFVHQFAMRKNLDQALTTRSDLLSTFNRKIVNKYKAGLGLQYLDKFLQDDILKLSLNQFYKDNLYKNTESKSFKNILKSNTKKNLDWFFGDYIQTKKKIDYTIKKIKKTTDSLEITIKNNKKMSSPVLLYGLRKDKSITYKKWFVGIDSIKKIKIPRDNYDRFSLNYENIYPEIILNNNWRSVKPRLFNRPLQFRFMKDIDNPFYNQLFYNIEYDYNFYDGILTSLSLSNETFVKKKWRYKIKPEYGFKSKKITGSLSFLYTHYPENSNIYKIRSGLSAKTSHYAPNLSYKRFSPYISIDFNRNSLRDVGGKYILSRFIMIDKEISSDETELESDNYKIFNTRFGYSKPNIINNIGYSGDFQLSKKFSKLSVKFYYKKLSERMKRYNLRVYAATFLHNKTTSGFFDFSLNRPSDYLFDYSYFGRSEKNGFLSQQFVLSEGGFKSIFDRNTANQWMLSSNLSFSIWRWVELYGDAGFYKNKNLNPTFKYDSGIRLNFVPNFFEVYFPIQSSNGFEPNQVHYNEKIRFVLSLSFGRFLSFAKRGFY